MKYSECIDAFLKFLRDAAQDYNIAMESERIADDETQDLLHELELHDSGDEQRARLAAALSKVRKERRAAKDTAEMLLPVGEWAKNNETVIHGIERLLGKVRVAEGKTENRYYRNRTEIVEKTLGGGDFPADI